MSFENFLAKISLWLSTKGLKIFLILFLAFLINEFFQFSLKRILIKRIKEGIKEETKKKGLMTLFSTIGGTLRFIIFVVAILTVLPEFGINTSAILASLGIASLALGMAASGTISDFISGIFILLENQYFVGDKIKIGNLEGEVVDFNLRRTVIKDKEGFLHFIPNREIKIVAKKVK